MKLVSSIALILLAGLAMTCSDGHLRGSISKSEDSKTYFAVDDDNGGGCGPIKVDGAVWPHAIGAAVEISPGLHTIECGGEITFKIPKGMIYRFNYWGP